MAHKKSTALPENGWGMFLQELVGNELEVVNLAQNGRSTRTFIEEGRWTDALKNIRAGDYVVVQFGHNDEVASKKSSTSPAEFDSLLRKYIRDVKAKNALPILLTSLARRKFSEQHIPLDTHERYAAITKKVAQETQTVFVDADLLSRHILKLYGPEQSQSLFHHLPAGTHQNYPNGVSDDTHFSPKGAALFAHMIWKSISRYFPEWTAEKEQIIQEKARNFHQEYTVAQDGSGDFYSIQEAIDAVRDLSPHPVTIRVKPGLYVEKILIPATKTNIHILGTSADAVSILWDDHAGRSFSLADSFLVAFRKNEWYPSRTWQTQKLGTFDSYTVKVLGRGTILENISIENLAGPVGQAVALHTEADRVQVLNCKILGHQDTLYVGLAGSKNKFQYCLIEGTTDFIFGSATAWFYQCRLISRKNSYLTAASTPQDQSVGLVFYQCKLLSVAPANSVYLGRPWRPYAYTAFLECTYGNHIRPEGWHNWNNSNNEKTARYMEFNNSNESGMLTDSMLKQRVNWSKQLYAHRAQQLIRWGQSEDFFQKEFSFSSTPHPINADSLRRGFVAHFSSSPSAQDQAKKWQATSDSLLEQVTWVVASDGSGDFSSLQKAIDAVPDYRKKKTVILLKKGIYAEKLIVPESKQNILLIGESVDETIVGYNQHAKSLNAFGEEVGTSGSASVYIYGRDITVMNISFVNTAGPVGQAVAMFTAGDKIKFIACRFLGYQDTLYTYGVQSRQYFTDCVIEGTVDFIFGSSTAWFENCLIWCKQSGYITAASTPEQVAFGYVFNRCEVNGTAPPHSFYWGRPWRPFAKTYWMNTTVHHQILRKEGWHNWGKTSNEKTTVYREYNTVNVLENGRLEQLKNKKERVAWAKFFTPEEAAAVHLEAVMKDWNPLLF